MSDETTWTHPTDMTLDDFRREGLSVPGTLVEFHNRYAGGTETALIGHMNDLLGVCDDCHEDGGAQVVRYRRVWSPEGAPSATREEVARALEGELGCFLARDPHRPDAFWGGAADALLDRFNITPKEDR